MRKVVAYELMSLDGVVDEPDAFITAFDEVMRENLGRVIATQDTVLLGRRTYDDWARFWPGSGIQPFAGFINAVQKFVVTSTQPTLQWAHAEVVPGNVADFVSERKRQVGGDIGLHGSISLVQSLLDANLIDELRLVVAPAVQHHGRTLFGRANARRLRLTRCIESPTGHLLVDYQLRI